MPDEIVQHREFNRHRRCQQVADAIRIVGENKQRGRLQSKPKYADHIEPDEMNHECGTVV